MIDKKCKNCGWYNGYGLCFVAMDFARGTYEDDTCDEFATKEEVKNIICELNDR